MRVEPGAAAAVVLNVAITQPTTDGWITLFAGGSQRPYASNLNYRAGETVANLVVVPVNELWHVDVYNAGGPAHLVVDLVGWYDDSLGDLELPAYERAVPGIVFWEADVVVDLTSTCAFISNTGKDRIEVLHLADGLFEAPIPVGAKPMGLDLSPAGDRLYAGTAGGLSVVDLAARTELGRIAIPAGIEDRPFDVAVLANGHRDRVDHVRRIGLRRRRVQGRPGHRRGHATDRLRPHHAVHLAEGQRRPAVRSRRVRAGRSDEGAPLQRRHRRLHRPARGAPGLSGRGDRRRRFGDHRRRSRDARHAHPCPDINCGTAGVAVTAAGDVAYAIGLTGIRVCNLGSPTLAKNVALHVDGVGQLALTPDESRLVGITDTGVVVGKPFV